MMSKYSSGQAMITMLFIMVIGVVLTTGAVFALYSNTTATTQYELGALAYQAAESGIENGILRLIRDPAYSGEILAVDSDRIATISVSGTSPIVITSVGKIGFVSRQVQVAVQYTNGILTIISWGELL